MFFGLLLAWGMLFHWLGNSTVGYAMHTRSLFRWMEWMYLAARGDEDHGRLIPLVVLALFWWKRRLLSAVPKRHWWPGAGWLALALGLHLLGTLVQQTQISVVAFFAGVYALMGLTWGPRWLAASFFPVCLFVFCVPMMNVLQVVTVPLRILASGITSVICHVVLGIQVVQDGTRIFDALGHYQYEVAAACSGIRSLTATAALAMIYAFVALRSPWRRGLMLLATVPLAVAANIVRLSTIVIAAEAYGQSAGNVVHESSWFSLLPYVPALAGILLLGRWLREEDSEHELTPGGDQPHA